MFNQPYRQKMPPHHVGLSLPVQVYNFNMQIIVNVNKCHDSMLVGLYQWRCTYGKNNPALVVVVMASIPAWPMFAAGVLCLG